MTSELRRQQRPRVIPHLEAIARWSMALLLLAFFGAWVQGLGGPALTGDEAFIAIESEKPALAILQRLNADEPHPPGYYVLMRAWHLAAGGRNEFIIRYPSLLIGVLLLSVIGRIGRYLGLGLLGASGAALLVGLNPQISLHLREARMYGLMLLSLAAATLAALSFARHRAAVWVAAGASLLALLSHYFNAFFILALGAWGLMTHTQHTRRGWIISQGLAWTAFAVWTLFFGRGFFNPTSLSAGKTWSVVLMPWETWYRLAAIGATGYRGYAEDWRTYLAAPLLAVGWLVGSGVSRGRARWLLALMVAAPLLAYGILGALRPVFHAKYMLPWLLFAALAAGQWLQHWRWTGGLAAFMLVALMIGPALDTLRRPYDPGLFVPADASLTSDTREMVRRVQQLAGPTDVFGLGAPDWAHCYYAEHYFGRDLGCALIPQYPSQSLAELNAQVDDLLARHRLLWYLDSRNPAWDPSSIAPIALGQRAVSLGALQTASRTLQLYVGPEAIRREQQVVRATFGDFAELTGVWAAQAEALHVVLVWRALADQPSVNAKVFVHLVDPSGWVFAQSDAIPVNWTRPVGTWRINEQLLDAHALNIGPEVDLSTASLLVGLYEADTLERVAAFDEAGARLTHDAAPIPLVLH